jgi:beta-ureidopropionase / N-carbamoyl-L-amino-acid hydrolase
MVEVSGARQWDRMMELAKLGAIPGDGVNRACLTELDRAARRLVISWAERAGAVASVDAAGNLFLRRAGAQRDAAPVLTGSHLDSQPQGGRFDGAYGVVAGIEVLAALHDAGVVTARPVEVVAWTNEEGGRFQPGCTGSMAWAGVAPVDAWDEVRDLEGVRYGDALAALLASEADLPRRPLGSRPHAYIEAHIEQGPLLEAEGLDVGVVTGIQGSRWFRVTVTGASAHAGTAPVSMRRDALQDAIRAISALNVAMADPDDVLRFTVGKMVVSPNSSNSVAGQVVFTIDLRHPDRDMLVARGDAVGAVIQQALLHCTAEIVETFHALPSGFDADVMATIERAAIGAGVTHRRMASGAFHDAQFAARVAPAGMIFVPSKDGISHHPAEYSAPEQLARGTAVLARALVELAG